MEKENESKKSTKKLGIILGLVFIVITITFLIWAEGIFKQEKKSPIIYRTQNKKVESIEYKLAIIDAKGYISKDHLSVARFRSLLLQLSNTYVENKQQIADMTVKAQEILKKNEGIKESLLNIMEGMNQIFYKKIENQNYAEYMATYMALRRKGQSHLEAINGLKAIIETIIKD